MLGADPPHRGRSRRRSRPPWRINFGDIAATGFSGTKLQLERLPPGVDPVAKTVIDPDGSTLQILDGGTLTGPLDRPEAAFAGAARVQSARHRPCVWACVRQFAGRAAPRRIRDFLRLPRPHSGCISSVPTRTATANLTASRKARLAQLSWKGSSARCPGAVREASGKSIVQRAPSPSLPTWAAGGVKNSGPGIGGLAFDPASRTLYASDLDTGLIHRLSVANGGTDQGQFDYGVTARP